MAGRVQVGDHLGVYEILAPLGVGGMGEVYRARDARLDREIAIKVLPSELAADPDRRARFEREARALAAMNHPNIVAIHDVGNVGGVGFVVMELLEGETLRATLTSAPLSWRRAIDYAAQMARGLAAAHERGLVHRDLKPENVFVTRDGRVKILDFGIAKVVEPGAVGDGGLTRTVGTEPGVVLGTVGYMSPEQVHGRPADGRSDIFSLGAILYEMITGRRAFAGDSAVATLSAILRDDPPALATSIALVPPALDRVIRRCVEKAPEARFHSAHDLAFQLESLPVDSSNSSAVPAPRIPGMRTWLRAAAIILALATAWWIGRRSAAPAETVVASRAVTRMTIQLPDSERIALARTVPYGIGRPSLALSPDGRHLVYVVERGEARALKLQTLDQFEARTIAGTEDAFAPFFSPNGEWIGFFTDTHLKKVFRDGGAPIIVSPASNVFGAAWGPDDTITFIQEESRRLSRVSADGRTVSTLLSTPSVAAGWQWPSFLDADTILLSPPVWSGDAVLSWRASASAPEPLLSGGTAGRYVPSGQPGHLVLAGQGSILAVPFDHASRRILGQPRPIVEGVRTEAAGNGQFTVSDTGTLAYVPGGSALNGRLVWRDLKTGAEEPVSNTVRRYGTPSLSQDGSRLAVVVHETRTSLWILEIATDRWRPLPFDSGDAESPFWDPDGKTLYFTGRVGGKSSIYKQRIDENSRATEFLADARAGSFSAGGRAIAFSRDPHGILVYSFATGKAETVATTGHDYHPSLSPDGKLLAYASDRSGRAEVFLQRHPGSGELTQVSFAGGEEPRWLSNADLLYRNGQRWMRVSVSTTPILSTGTPQRVLDGPFVNVPGFSYAIHPDGKRLLMIQESTAANTREIRLVFNWFAELRAIR